MKRLYAVFHPAKFEAIAFEIFKQQDLSGKTPADAFDLYQSIYQEIKDHCMNRIEKSD